MPPAPMPRAVLHGVLALVACLIAGIVFGQLDVVATAEGRLVPQTYVKIVQPAEAGIVRDILVREGQSVAAGEVLMRLDAALSEADDRAVRAELTLKQLQLRRIEAELNDAPLERIAGVDVALQAEVAHQYAAHRQAYQDALTQERAIESKTGHDLQAARELARKFQESLPVWRQSAAAFAKLGRDGFYSALAVAEKQRDHTEKEQDLRAQEATVASLRAQHLASTTRLAQITSNYRSTLHDERVNTAAQERKLREDLAKLTHKNSLLQLRAPQAGVIKDLATHTVGTVVAPGTVLMSLVPAGEALQAEVFVRNDDVGFVHPGQAVKVKLAAYPFAKYGMLDGRVAHLGADAADVPAAAASARGADGGAWGGDSAPAGPRYKALVRLESQQLLHDQRPLPLISGMQVSAEVHLGRRSVFDYLLSPVRSAWHEAARER